MASILDNIFGNKKNPANSFLPLNEQEMQEEANRMPDIPETKASDVENTPPAEIVQAQQQTTPAPNKWGYSDSDMEYLAKFGYTPEKLEQIANFDPSKGNNYLQHLYESTVTKPQAPDEEKLKKANLWGGIADGVSSLVNMWSVGKGAYATPKEYKNSALGKLEGRERELADRYLKLSNQYEGGLFNAKLKDFLNNLGEYKNEKKGIQGILATKQALEEKARQADAKNQYNYTKLAYDQANRDRDYELKKQNAESMDRHRKALEGQGWARVADSKSRTTAYVKKMSSGSGSNKNYQMIFAAHPNDPDAVKDNQLGASVRVFEMSKGEIDRYAREAREDKDFMTRHPELTIKSKGLPGNDTEKLRPNEDIAAAWIEEQYSKGFTASPAIPSVATPPFMNWSPWVMPNYLPNYTTPSNEEEIDYPEDGDEDEDFPIEGSMNVATF